MLLFSFLKFSRTIFINKIFDFKKYKQMVNLGEWLFTVLFF